MNIVQYSILDCNVVDYFYSSFQMNTSKRYNHLIELFADITDTVHTCVSVAYKFEDIMLKTPLKSDDSLEIVCLKFMCIIIDDRVDSIILFVKRNEEEIALYHYRSEFIIMLSDDKDAPRLCESNTTEYLQHAREYQTTFRKFDPAIPDMTYEFIFDRAKSKIISIDEFRHNYLMMKMDAGIRDKHSEILDLFRYYRERFPQKTSELKHFDIRAANDLGYSRFHILYLDGIVVKVQ